MNTRLLVIIVIGIIGIFFGTYYTLDWYDIYDSSDVNTPKPGDKYYIEPERKAYLETFELDLRNKITKLHQTSPLTSYAVNLDHATKKIVVIVETEQFNLEIEKIISQYPDDVPIVFYNSKIELQDEFNPKENSSTEISKKLCMNIYQQSLDNSLHLDEYRKNFVAWLTQCNENGYLQDTDVDFYLDVHYEILGMTCEEYTEISTRFISDLQRYAADIKYDECNPDENWLKFKYGGIIAKNED